MNLKKKDIKIGLDSIKLANYSYSAMAASVRVHVYISFLTHNLPVCFKLDTWLGQDYSYKW